MTTAENDSGRSCPVDVTVDLLGRLAVSDAFDRSVKIFDEAGKWIGSVGVRDGVDALVDPRGVCTDERGRILVADWGKG